MAFKPVNFQKDDYENIESLFRDLSSSIQSLYSHQSDILRHYLQNAINHPNVAIELPTGSGKTLVGLLIAEYNRRKKGIRALYLCPTKQLVNQVVSLANTEYGINAIGFTGPNKDYDQTAKHRYKNGDAIAVTTYSSLFNIKPWFTEPGIIIIDDAHTSENYIAHNWSVEIDRGSKFNAYSALIDILKPKLSYSVYSRLTNETVDYLDKERIEKIPNNSLHKLSTHVFDILSTYLDEDEELKYSWSMIRHNLDACQIYLSWKSILIRPLIPPSLSNEAFNSANQRVFMSATLGQGGDLQRITGIESFYKIPIPEGWDTQGVGRRFFMFPELSLSTLESKELMFQLLKISPRSVILVSSEDQVQTFRDEITLLNPEINFFTARDIEKSKEKFIESSKGAVVMANRFDGIDFPGDQSRMLFLIGIPYASNLQERFFQTRMNASIILNDRNRTRLIQAIGRCTRSPKDYSAICVIGEKGLSEWLVLKDKYKYFHPELQAELIFGVENSTGDEITINTFIENYTEFINQTNAWQAVNFNIIKIRSDRQQQEFDGAIELSEAASLEVRFVYQLWNKQYKEAFEIANQIIECLNGGKSLSGYRAYWNYQAGCVAELLYDLTSDEIYATRSTEYFEKLIRICPSATWARGVFNKTIANIELDEALIWNVENLQIYLSTIKITFPKKYREYIKKIEDAILLNNVEYANLHIGLILGFKSFKDDSQGAPDCIWISNNNIIYVFEDKFHSNHNAKISIEEIRQSLGHVEWVKSNISNLLTDVVIYPVLISNKNAIDQGTKSHCGELLYWHYEEFIQFSRTIISMARTYPNYYGGETDSNWKDFFADEFYNKQIGPKQIRNRLIMLKDL